MSRSALVALGIVSVMGVAGGCASSNLARKDQPLHVVRHNEQTFFGAGDAAGYALFSDRRTGRIETLTLTPTNASAAAN